MAALRQSQDLRFPIGRFVAPAVITADDRREAIGTLAEFPGQLREAVRRLSDEQLNCPYREDGWTVRQVVHHVADSHATAVHRFKKALTEDNPEIAGYDQAAFALLPDSHAPVEWSLELIEAAHARWVMLLETLTEEQFARTYRHAERGVQELQGVLVHYAWHSRHHLAHIRHLRARMGW